MSSLIRVEIKPSTVSEAFICLEPDYLAKNFDDLNVLCDFYGNQRSANHPISGLRTIHDPIINKTDTLAEYPLYTQVIQGENLKGARDSLEFLEMDLYYQQMFLKLLELAAICPFGNAVVERLFSKLKLVKTKNPKSV